MSQKQTATIFSAAIKELTSELSFL